LFIPLKACKVGCRVVIGGLLLACRFYLTLHEEPITLQGQVDI